MIKLIDKNGDYINNSVIQTGLLLFNGRTICNTNFDSHAADAFCKELGYPLGAIGWTSDISFAAIQSRLSVGAGYVICGDSATWDSCAYHENSHGCSHDQDVFLTCKLPGEANIYSLCAP